jgi:hypothetical protein
MLTAPFPARALAGGYDLDPDLPQPDDPHVRGTLAGLHVLRHLDRLLQSLRLELVLPLGRFDEVTGRITHDYDDDVVERELCRYKIVKSKSFGREVTRNPRLVPFVGMTGSCLGWSEYGAQGAKLADRLAPGRLFAFEGYRFKNAPFPRGGFQYRVYLAAWQEDFPTHCLVSWGNNAELSREPMAIDPTLREAACRMFVSGSDLTR